MKSLFSRGLIALALTSLAFSHAEAGNSGRSLSKQWSNWGQNFTSNRHNINNRIPKRKADELALKCVIDHTGDGSVGTISANPAIVNDTIFWSSRNGTIGARKLLRDQQGKVIGCDPQVEGNGNWIRNVGALTNSLLPAASRGTPVFYYRKTAEGRKGTLLLNSPASPFDYAFGIFFGGGATPQAGADAIQAILETRPFAYAVDAETGTLLWKIPLVPSYFEDSTVVAPSTTSSASIVNGVAYFGLSSFNNVGSSLAPLGYVGSPLESQTSSGKMIALDLGVGGSHPYIKWVQNTMPPRPSVDPHGQPVERWFAGGGVWASAPSFVPYRGKGRQGLVVFNSGQLYDYPSFVADCMQANPQHLPAELQALVPAGVHIPASIDGYAVTKLGETGVGADVCYQYASQQLRDEWGIDEPIASNSVIVVNAKDGSIRYNVPLAGIDAWQQECGNGLGLSEDNPGCDLEVVGPDWDNGGSSPILRFGERGPELITHTKGGLVAWINLRSGKVKRKIDVCVGSTAGGILWGMNHDPFRDMLFVPCSGSAYLDDPIKQSLADGSTICRSGVLNGIDARNGKLKWQAVAGSAIDGAACDAVNNPATDARFKFGLDIDATLKNAVDPRVRVWRLDPRDDLESLGWDLEEGPGRMTSPTSSSRGVVYLPIYDGSVYALNARTGRPLRSEGEDVNYSCDFGAINGGGVSTAAGVVAVPCGRNVGPVGGGSSIMIYGID